MRRGRGVCITVLAALMTACGAPSGPGPQATTPAEPLVVVTDRYGFRLVALDGKEVLSVQSPAGGGTSVIGTAASRVVYLETTDQKDDQGKSAGQTHTVKAIDRGGQVETLRAFGPTYPTFPVVSPDGRQLLWTEVTSASGSPTAQSRLHLTTFGGPDRIVTSYQAPEGLYRLSVIAGYRWDAGGAIVAYRVVGWPWPGNNMDVLDAFLLDPVSASLSPLWPGSTCTLPARAADGTVACVLVSSTEPTGLDTLQIGNPPSVSRSIQVNTTPGLGSLSFRPGSPAEELVIGRNVQSQEFPSGAFASYFGPTVLVDLKTGEVRPFGPDGMMAPKSGSAWLEDGSLLEWNLRPAQADPSTTEISPVTFVVTPDGRARELTTGAPVGVLP